MAKQVNLFTSNLEGRALIQEKAATRKATAAALANFAASIDAEFTKVIKDQDRRARNVANAAKGRYQTAAAARGIVRAALDNFTKTVGAPVVELHAAGDRVE